MEDYYQILSVSPGASQEAIKKRYRFLAFAYHPDRFPPTQKEDAQIFLTKINEAYGILSNPERRTQYDKDRSSADSSYEEGRRKRQEAEAVWRRAQEAAEAAWSAQQEAEAAWRRAEEAAEAARRHALQT